MQLEYNKLAKYYDKIYSEKDYNSESKQILDIISKTKQSAGRKLLDIACGTGVHISYFKKKYDVIGIDINKNMLSIARKKFPDTQFYEGDMLNFKLATKFDIITCLFNSITYIHTKKKLESMLQNIYKYLNTDGIILVESSIIKNNIKEFKVIRHYKDKNLTIDRIILAKVTKKYIRAETEYLISEKGNKPQKYIDVHNLRLYKPDEFMYLMKKVGFKVKKFKNKANGYDVFVGVKQ